MAEVPSTGIDSSVLPFTLAKTDVDTTFQSASHSIGLTDSVTLSSIFKLASDRLFFFGANAPTGQAVSHNFVYRTIVDAFSFESLSGFNQEFDVVQYLGFTPRFFAPDIRQELFGPLGAGNKVAESFVVDATNTFSFLRHDSPFNEALVRAYNAGNLFGFTSTIFVHQIEDAEDTFSFQSIVDASSSSYTRPATHGVIKQHLTFHVTRNDCGPEKIYTPFVGDTPDPDFPAISEIPPTLGTGTLRFELSIPPAPLTSITLKNPEFSNADELRFTRLDRRTRGGDRKLFSDQDWGTVQTLRLRVARLCDKDADEIINFLNVSNGRQVTLFDWEGRQWPGLILNASTEVFTDENDTTTFDIVFEGQAV
jgi:hypothetical protein